MRHNALVPLLAASLLTGCELLGESPASLGGVEERLAPLALVPGGEDDDSTTDSVDDLSWVTVDAFGSGDYLHPADAVAAGERRIRVLAGEYVLESALTITEQDVWLEGVGADQVVLVQANPEADGVRLYADGASLSGLTIDAATANAQAAVVIGDANDVLVTDNHIIGSAKQWAVYAAGPEHTVGTLDDLVLADLLSTNNEVSRNTISSPRTLDAVSFAGQSGGRVEDNVIEGTLNVFLCRDTTVVDNWLHDAPGPGLSIDLPSLDLTIERNTIQDSAASGIRIGPQSIHPVDTASRSGGIALLDNVVVNSGYFGVEVDGTEDLTLQGNLIAGSFYDGLYLLRSDRPLVVDNTIQDIAQCAALPPGFDWPCDSIASVYLEAEVESAAIESNVFSNLASLASHAVLAAPEQGNSETLIDGNTLLGDFAGGDYVL